MTVTSTSTAALLLTNRIVDVGAKPLSAGEFWGLQGRLADLDRLAGMSVADVQEAAAVSEDDAERVVALLGAGTAFAFERERLLEEGVDLISALDERFPHRLVERLGSACPAFLLVAGPVEFLDGVAIGVVGSRDASPAALDVATRVGSAATSHDRAVVSGLARGIDQAAMAGALDAGAPVIGVPTEGVRVVARSTEIRSRVHAGELCLVSPYGPGARFSTGNAMGRNKVVYALAERTLVVCSDQGKGGTWEGAREAMRRSFGHVMVWAGDGDGPGNAALARQGAQPVTSVEGFFQAAVEPFDTAAPAQGSLFG